MSGRKVDWTEDMLTTLRDMRRQGVSLLLCSEKVGVSYPTTVLKERELGLSQRMNRGNRRGERVMQADGASS